eukprot:Lithocolla_globosa_v1_NODE_2681_length_1906_cov_23.872501.p2 type:complete len:249 gc:universal NODE_2681_length_1906_cov_23.872501:837-91(-)
MRYSFGLMADQAKKLVDQAKKLACYAAIDDFVKDGMCIGVGSGSTIVFAIDRLEEKVKKDNFKLSFVPTSFQSQVLLQQKNMTVTTLDVNPVLDVCFDGADEVDANLDLIKGGGGCQTLEKIVAAAAKQFVIVCDYTKDSDVLGSKWKKGVPIEVLPMTYVPIMNKLKEMGGTPVLRMGGAGTKMGPVVTDNGNLLIDCDFGSIQQPDELNRKITMLPGVLESGLFPNMAVKAYFGQQDGTVVSRTRK